MNLIFRNGDKDASRKDAKYAKFGGTERLGLVKGEVAPGGIDRIRQIRPEDTPLFLTQLADESALCAILWGHPLGVAVTL